MKVHHDDTSRTSNTVAAQGPSTSTVVVATRFVVRRRRDTMAFLLAALASSREAEALPGFLGGTVLADLWNNQFWTVSAWASPEAVRAFGAAPAHARAMRRTEAWAVESQVERWRTSATRLPTLAETAERFGVAAPRRGLLRRLRPRHPVPPPSDPLATGSDDPSNLPVGPPRLSGRHGPANSTQES